MNLKSDEILEYAEREYLKSLDVLRVLCQLKNGDLDKKRYVETMSQFEAALQGIFLYAAIQNGEFSKGQYNFITRVTIYGEILPAINSAGRRMMFRNWNELTWDNILESGNSEDTVKEAIRTAIDNVVVSFVQPLAEADRDISTRNFIQELGESMRILIRAICIPPDTDMDEETIYEGVDQGMKLFEDKFKGYWSRYSKNNENIFGAYGTRF